MKLGSPIREQPVESAPKGTETGENVWIGTQCSILKGAKIDEGAVIDVQL